MRLVVSNASTRNYVCIIANSSLSHRYAVIIHFAYYATTRLMNDALLQVYVARRPKVFTQETLTFTDVELCVEGYER